MIWALVCLFPIYWTVTTSFKIGADVTRGHLVPFVDFQPDWRGWRSLGLSPDTIGEISTPRDEFLKRFKNSVVIASARRAGRRPGFARGLRAQPLLLPFAWMRNKDISFFFLSQLILPPVVLALPFLVLYRSWPCSTPASA